MDYLKAEQLSTSKWRVLALPFGGPFGGKDWDGEFFSERTDPKGPYAHLKEFPVAFHHAQDEDVDDAILGVEDDLVKEKDGWWGTVWLERSNRYWERVNDLLQRGKMYGSSGAVPQFVRTDKTGEIKVWPHIEQTLTPTPANPFARIVPMKAISHFSSAGIELPRELTELGSEPDLRADLSSDGDAAATAHKAALRHLLEVTRAEARNL